MSETEDTDLEALLVGIARGENKAMEAFYDSTVNRVFSLCLRITREESLAEEVVCDTYLQVWQHANDYDRARGDVIAWPDGTNQKSRTGSVKKEQALSISGVN